MAKIKQHRRRRLIPKDEKNIYQRSGGIWWLRFNFKGKQRFQSLDTTNKDTARSKANKIISQPELSGLGDWQNEVFHYCHYILSYGDKRQRERSAESTEYVLENFFKWSGGTFLSFKQNGGFYHWSGGKRPEEITREHCSNYIHILRNRLAPRSVHTYHARLKTFFDYLLEEQRIRFNPFFGISLPKIVEYRRQPGKVVELSLVKQALRSCRNRNLQFVLYCGFNCGMRKNEIVNSRPSWFNLEKGVVAIPAVEYVNREADESKPDFETKARNYRKVPLSKHFLRFLKVYKRHFFNGRTYMLGIDKPYYVARYRYDFRTALETFQRRKGLVFSPHSMRHTFITRAIENGNSVEKVAAWSGDRIKTIELNYWHPDDVKGHLDFY